MRYKQQQELVSGLRELADFIEDNIGLPITGGFTLHNYVNNDYDRETYTEVEGTARLKMRVAALAMGSAEKRWDMHGMDLRKTFGSMIQLNFRTTKDNICEKKVVGFKEHPAKVIEAYTEELVEWECRDSILATK